MGSPSSWVGGGTKPKSYGKKARKQHAAQLVQPVLFVPLELIAATLGSVDNDVEHLGIILVGVGGGGRLSWLFPCTYSFITVCVEPGQCLTRDLWRCVGTVKLLISTSWHASAAARATAASVDW